MVDTATNAGKAAFAAALAAVLVGSLVFAGWLLDLEPLKRLGPGLVAMNPATAVAFILAGISLALALLPRGANRRSCVLRWSARLCALLIMLVGLATTIAIMGGWDLGVDRWIYGSKLTDGSGFQHRMAPNTALNFMLLGSALLFVQAKKRSVRFCVEFAVVAAGFSSLLADLGYAYGIQSFYGLGPLSRMALPAAMTFSALAGALLLSHSDGGLLAVFAGGSEAGAMARRLLPAALLVPAALAWITRQGEQAGIFDVAMGDALEVVGNIVVFTFLICWSAKRLFKADQEREKAQTAMRESEERFAGAFEHAPIGVALIAPDGRWLKVNRTLCDLVGYPEEELLNCTIQDITYSKDLETSRENARRMITGEVNSFQMKKSYVHGRGHLVRALVNVSLVRDSQGRPNYSIAQIQDISEREHAENALLESKRFLQSTLDALSSHIAILDENGTIVEVNEAWGRFAGENNFKGRRCGVGTNYLEVCDSAVNSFSDEAAAVATGIRAVIARQSAGFNLEYPCHSPRKKGWFVVRVTRFAGDGPVRVVVAHENITERKLAEEKLRESETKFNQLANNITDVFWITSPDLKTMHYISAGYERIWGRSMQSLYDRPHQWMEAILPEDRENVTAGFATLMADAPQIGLQYRITRPDGSVRWVHDRGFQVRDPTGAVVRLTGIVTDITERKEIEQTLQRQQVELRALFDLMPAMIWFKNTENEILRVNRRVAEALGKEIEEIEGKPTSAIYPHDADSFYADDLEVIRSGAPKLGIVETMQTHRGDTIWVQTDKVPVRDETGKVIGIVVMAQDVTERKRTEEELLWKTAFLEAQVNSSLDGMLVVNEQSQKVLQNQRFAELLGIPQHIADDPDDKEQIAWVTNMTKQPESFLNKVRYLYAHPKEIGRDEIELKNGRVLDRYSAPVIAKDGTTYGRTWQFRDVTEQKRTEARFRRLVDSNVQSILFWNIDGAVTGANDAFLSLTGFTRDDLEAGRIDWISITPPEYAHLDRNALAEIAADGISASYEKEFIRKDGSRVPVLLGGASFADNPTEGVCFALDLTDRRRLEAQLLQSQKLETVGKLAGGVAHEFNSILTAIIGQSEMLLSEPPRGNRSSEIATEIRSAAQRAAILTRQLLAYGSKQILQPTTLDLNAVLSGMEDTLRPLVGKGTAVKIVSAAGLRPVKVDAEQIEQVIMNLVINAGDAMPDGGTLTLETSNVVLDQEYVAGFPELKAGDYVMLTVKDTGVGMSEAIRARAFEPFFTTKPIGKGTGLGLSTCYGIIKQSGGLMTVDSEPVRGSTFRIYLPAAEPAAAVPSGGGIPTGLPRGTETILLVEGDATMREIMETLLMRLGYTVFAVANGIEALNLKEPNGLRIDLLLTDLDMPDMDGKVLAERFREQHPQARTLLASASTFNTAGDQGRWNENAHYLRKPFPPSALAHKLREVLTPTAVPDPNLTL